MQARVIEMDTPRTFNMMVCPPQHHSTEQYIRGQFDNINVTLTKQGQEVINQARQKVEAFYDPHAIRVAKAALQGLGNVFAFDQIVTYQTLEEIQNANPIMQQYIMANPVIRKIYHQQRCDGYSDTYVDEAPDDIGHTHSDYLRATEGLVSFDPKERDSYAYTQVYEDNNFHEPLTVDNRFDIAEVYDLVEYFVKHKVDPVNQFGGEIG